MKKKNKVTEDCRTKKLSRRSLTAATRPVSNSSEVTALLTLNLAPFMSLKCNKAALRQQMLACSS